ncbi:monocarboxylate transporter 12 [Venturia canescens]|uniref:monocarboxylate transporter 12 n=1 Tax=Venturia canescens TaxID=32260 RepID=UPI001C9CA530|nr:monocarboxylate transporter 12 [Venturia canescens]
MSLPREWSYLQESCRTIDRGPKAESTSREMCLGEDSGLVYPSELSAASTIIDENMNQSNQLGSLFSIHSAPVFDLNGGCTGGAGILSSPTRPGSLVVQTTATSTPIVPPHLQSPPDTIEDDDNDNLLTISSLTARPLIAKSRELRSSKCHYEKKYKPRRSHRSEHDCREKRAKNIHYVPLDGGYGWIVVCGAFFVQFWVAGLVKSYGLLYVEVMETFRDSSAAVASWIPAILSFFCLALAPVTSMLCQKYSCRVVVFIGGLFCALGLTISFFATSLVHLFFTFGVLTGIGGGLSTTPGIIIVSQYFDKHRALANGICVSGTAAGSFVFPLLIEALVSNFGFHGTILLLGGCMLHVCVSATLYRPLEDNPAALLDSSEAKGSSEGGKGLEFAVSEEQQRQEEQQQQQQQAKQQRLELLFANDTTTRHNLLNELFNQKSSVVAVELTDSEEEKDIMGEAIRMKPISKIRSSSILHSVEDLSTDSTCVYKARASLRSLRSSAATVVCPAVPREPIMPDQESINAAPRTLSQKIALYIDLTLLKNPQFIMMCLSVSLMSTGSPYMLYYLPAYVHAAGYSKSEAGYLVAISAALDLFGRLGLGWLSDLQLFDRRKGYIGSIVGAGVAVLAIPMAHSFYVLACSVGMYGLCLGCWFLLVPVLLADQYGTDKISSSYGLVRMFQSVGAISIPPLAGYLRDVTGSYSVCFLCMGTCMVLGGLPLLLVSSEIVQKSTSTLQVSVTDEASKEAPTVVTKE